MTLVKNKSKDFRYIYCNGFGLQGGGNEMALVFGYKENPADDDTDSLNEVGIIMLPPMVKLLAVTLSEIVAHLEKVNQTEIPFDATKLDSLKKQLEATDPSTTSQLPPS